jgi:hypothetical protein
MSAWNVTSVAPVLVSGFESRGDPHLHIPHMAEDGPGVRTVSRPRLVRREAVVSLDTSRTPGMLPCCGELVQ